MQTIKFNKTLTAKGKNGMMKQTGVELMGSTCLMISPTNSRGATDSCWVEFPFSQIPDLITGLKQELDNYIGMINRAQGQFQIVVVKTRTGKVLKMQSSLGCVSHKEILEKAKDLIGWEWYWRAATELHGVSYPF